MTRKSTESATYRVQVLERAVDILQVLSEDSRELAAGEVAERLSLHKSTIHRLLAVLDHHRLIRKNADTGKYALGLRLFEVGTRAVRGLRMRDQAQPHLEQLAKETGERGADIRARLSVARDSHGRTAECAPPRETCGTGAGV